MAKRVLIMLYIFNALFILGFVAISFINSSIFFIIFGILIIVWFLAFISISIVTIFNLIKLIKQFEKDKLKKMAESVKLYSIPFWIINFILLALVTIMAVIGTRGILIFFVPVPIIITYIILLGTSVFSISYITMLHKEDTIGLVQMIIHIALQLFFFWDIVDIIYLKLKYRLEK